MRLVIVAGLLGTFLAAGALHATTAMRSVDSITPDDMPRMEVVSSDAGGVSLLLELPTLSVEEISVGGESFQSVEIPGGGITGEIGHPVVPSFTRLVAIPDGAGVAVTSVVDEETDYAGIRLVPMQSDEGPEFAYDDAAYSIDAFQARTPAVVSSPAICRDLRVVALTFNPVQYNPVTRTLRVSERMRVDVTFEGQDPQNVRQSNRHSIPPSFDQLYRGMVVNYTEPPRGMSVQPGTYLVICPNDSGVISRLQPLLDWRKRMGYSVALATTAQTGTTVESIKSYIQGIYNNADPPLEYVVLAGDATTPYQIRTWYETVSGYGGEGDDPYTKLEGNDVLSDIHIGRLSFATYAELETIVAKIVGYESTPFLDSDPGWFTRACLVGDPYDSGISTVMVQQWIKRRIRQIGYTDIDTIYADPFVSQMRTALNLGDTIFSYRGIYGVSGWQNSNTYALTNGWKMFFAVVLTCDTGSFASGTARSEAFLRAGTAASPAAGIGGIGMATTGTHTRYNNCMHLGIYRGLIYEGSYNLGACLTRGKYEMYLNYQENEPNIAVIWSHWANLIGDPATECWTGYPQPLTVGYPTSIPVGANAVTITVEEGGAPAVNAQVCLLKEGETHSTGYTDAEGAIELPVSALTQGQMLVTVTKHNRHPHLGTIQVVGQSRYVGYFGADVDDDGVGESSGNADSLINPGETIELTVRLKNFGSQVANGVTATLSTSDPYVSISDDSESFGNIAPGGVGASTDDFDLSVSLACPHNHTVRFGLDITSGSDQWHSVIDLSVVSADLQANGDYTLYNVGGNGRLDPGETGQISIALVNVGGAQATSPSASLRSLSQYITIPDSHGSYASINVGATGENTSDAFTVEVAPECYEGYEAQLQLLLEFSGGALDTTNVMVPISLRESNDPIGPDPYGYYAFDDTDTAYPEAPTYSWIEIDPNLGGSGTVISLDDYGTFQDDSQVVDLPFPFQYYGKAYTKATICSNGWLCMGSTWTAEYRNWTIPGAGGPEAMIAPFWDDLYQNVSTSRVCRYYDQANNRWIVEWSRLRNDRGGYEETFEAILLDPAYYTTDTGDGEIIFQYKVVRNPDSIDNYATVGIENETQSIGLLYTYGNDYPPGAATLVDGRAIRIIPKRELLSGLIHGTVRNASADGLPIGRATVTVVETEDEYETAANGTYEALEPAGIYTIRAACGGFQPDTVSAVDLAPGGSVQVDFDLIDISPPSIVTTVVETTNDSIGPYPVHVTISDASPLDERLLYYRINGGAFQQLTLNNLGGNLYKADIPGQSWTSRVEYYIHVVDAGDNLATDPPDAPNETFVFFVAPTLTFYLDEMELEGGWTVGSPEDAATAGLWVRVDPNGTYHEEETVQPEDDHTADPGALCWVTGNGPPGSGQDVADVDNGKTTLTSPPLYLAVEGIVVLRYYRWFTNDMGQAPGEDVWVVQVSDDNGATWIDLERTYISERAWRLMEFDLSEYIALTEQVRIRFIAEDSANFSTVEAAVDDVEILLTGMYQNPSDVEEGMQARFDLWQNTPNPFNPLTTIGFSIESASATRLIVYDVRGRVLRRLVDGVRPAGSHSVVWDGRDDAGHPVPSGIYLYRLESGSRAQTRKMILLQ